MEEHSRPSPHFTTGDRIDLSVRGKKPFDRTPSGNRAKLQALQTTTIIALVTAFFSVWYGLSSSSEQKHLPYAIVQDATTGELAYAGLMTESNLVLSDVTTQLFLKNFITKIRSVSNDKAVLLANRQQYGYLAVGQAIDQIDGMHAEYDPFRILAEEKTVDLQFLDSTKTSDLTWIIRWVEVEYSGGAVTGRYYKSGRFTLSQVEPDTIEAAQANPYNLRVVDFNITELRDPT